MTTVLEPRGVSSKRPTRADPLSDRATQSLIRKVLLPQEAGADKGHDALTPIDELLPPLTSRNDVDLQLYALLAIVLREFVQAWYGKITPDDAFVAEIVHVIAHCTRALEQRIRHVDLEDLVLNEIPRILDRHVTIYRLSHQQQSLHVNAQVAYHSLWPLPSLSPVPVVGDPIKTADQRANEAAYRQLLVQAVLSILLPTEDLENDCLTALVGQIFSELIIGNIIANKASQPWLLYEAICIAERVLKERREAQSHQPPRHNSRQPAAWSVQGFFLSLIQLVLLFISSVRFAFVLTTRWSSLPSRLAETDKNVPVTGDPHSRPLKSPIAMFGLWACVSNIIEIQTRMPWLSGFLSLLRLGMIQQPGRLAGLDGVLDRLISDRFHHFLSASHLPPILKSLRGSIFPNNSPGSSTLRPPSSDAEFRALRRRAATALLNILPSKLAQLYFGGGLRPPTTTASPVHERILDELEHLISVLDDEYCNKHLMYSVLEIVLVRLLPELQENDVEELFRGRIP